MMNHKPGDDLCQEIRPLRVNIHYAVELLFISFENVGANPRSHSSIVHEQIKAIESTGCEIEQLLPVRPRTHISLTNLRPDRFAIGIAARYAVSRGLFGRDAVRGKINNEIPADLC